MVRLARRRLSGARELARPVIRNRRIENRVLHARLEEESAVTRSQSQPLLSLILCSRNDRYMGNSLWRLETALNYVAGPGGGARTGTGRRSARGRLGKRDAPCATSSGSAPRRFESCPSSRSRPPWRGTSRVTVRFPRCWRSMRRRDERAETTSAGSIRTRSVGERFLRWFFDAVEGCDRGPMRAATPRAALLFANRRSIPYRLAVCCPSAGGPGTIHPVVRSPASHRDRERCSTTSTSASGCCIGRSGTHAAATTSE